MIAESQSSSIELHDARGAALQHLYRLANAHSKLFQAVNLVGAANQLINPRALTSGEHLQREGVWHGESRWRDSSNQALLKLSLTMLKRQPAVCNSTIIWIIRPERRNHRDSQALQQHFFQ